MMEAFFLTPLIPDRQKQDYFSMNTNQQSLIISGTIEDAYMHNSI